MRIITRRMTVEGRFVKSYNIWLCGCRGQQKSTFGPKGSINMPKSTRGCNFIKSKDVSEISSSECRTEESGVVPPKIDTLGKNIEISVSIFGVKAGLMEL